MSHAVVEQRPKPVPGSPALTVYPSVPRVRERDDAGDQQAPLATYRKGTERAATVEDVSDESDAPEATSTKGKGKATAVDDVDGESDVPKEANRKGKGRAATVEDVEDESESSSASSTQGEGDEWDEDGICKPTTFVAACRMTLIL